MSDHPHFGDGETVSQVEELGRASLLVPAPGGPLEPMPEGGEVQVVSSGWRLTLGEFTSNRLAVVGVGVLIFFVLFSFLGPVVYHTSQAANPALSDTAPSGSHIFGTNDQGLDELGQMMRGGQASLEVGALAAFMAIVVGTLFGAISGLLGGFVDWLMMRIVDVGLSMPFLLVVLMLATVWHTRDVVNISIVLAAFSWLVPARLVRGEVLTLRQRDFVWAARVMGSGSLRVVFKHLLPNALSVTVVNVTFLIADSILALSYLGFLGFGLTYPATSWGDMLGNALQYVTSGYWWLVYPVGICLVLVVLAANLVGDGLRDALDVRLRKR